MIDYKSLRSDIAAAMFDHIDDYFSDFKRAAGGLRWICNKHIDGTPSSSSDPDQTFIGASVPSNIQDQNGQHESVFDRYGRLNNLDFKQAERALAEAEHIEYPADTEDRQKEAAKQSALSEAIQLAQKALFKPEGASVLKYLTTTRAEGGRGYTEDFVRSAGLGCLCPASEQLLISSGYLTGPQAAAHPLLLPYISGGIAYGAKLRAINADIKPKYLNTDKLPTGAALYGLTRATSSQTLLIAEGEFDVLRAKYLNASAVATSGGGLTAQQIKQIQRWGYNSITLLLDTDAAGADFIKKSLKYSRYMPLYVAKIDGAKDIDEWADNHTKEDLRAVIDAADTPAVFLAKKLLSTAQTTGLTDRQRDDLINRLLRIAGGYSTDGITAPDFAPAAADIESIYHLIADTLQLIDGDALRRALASAKNAADKAAQEDHQKEAADIAIKQLTAANASKDYTAAAQIAARIAAINSRPADQLRGYSYTDLIADLQRPDNGLTTNWYFDDKDHPLILPAGAVTVIGAPTSHGKTTLLQQLAVNGLQDGHSGAVIYVTAEEAADMIYTKIASKYGGIQLRDYGHISCLRGYYADGARGVGYFFGPQASPAAAHNRLSDKQAAAWCDKQAQLIEDLNSQRLRIYYDTDAVAICQKLKQVANTTKIKAILIDYIQLLTIDGWAGQPRDMFKAVGLMLKDIAIQLNVPVIVAAQLNRTAADSPLALTAQTIADSADIERVADTVILCYNSTKQANKDSKNAVPNEGRLSRLCAHGFFADNAGCVANTDYIFALVAKSRNGRSDIEAFLPFDGVTGVVGSNIQDIATAGVGGSQTAPAGAQNLPF